MPLSHLRFRLALRFALAFLAGLVLLDVLLYSYLWVQSEQRLTRHMTTQARTLAAAVRREYGEAPGEGLAFAGREALREWPSQDGGYIVLSPEGVPLAERGPVAWLAASRLVGLGSGLHELPVGKEHALRRVLYSTVEAPAFGVAMLASTEALAEEREDLALWLLLSVPLVLGVSLTGGYVLSRRALLPIQQLELQIGNVSPERLNERLRTHDVPDEVDRVALQFNGLLDRLERARAENRLFLRQAAHQIRTPLTLVLGEATLAQRRGGDDTAAAFHRIRIAADQMQRRVNELFLLAEARTGERPALDDVVELDALVLECAEVLRGRAQDLGRRLMLDEVAPVVVRGNHALLREALLEMIENALRHGSKAAPVGVSVLSDAATTQLVVTNTGPPVPDFTTTTEAESSRPEGGLGLGILQWIATQHGGRLVCEHVAGRTRVSLHLPPGGAPDSSRETI